MAHYVLFAIVVASKKSSPPQRVTLADFAASSEKTFIF